MNKDRKIFVAGHGGLLGSALVRLLGREGFRHVITRTREELDLTDQAAVVRFFAKERPEAVIIAAARVGGINANRTLPAEFIWQNTQIQSNLIHLSQLHGVEDLVYYGSSCMYPRLCSQPMKEDMIFTGPFEPTNEAYALAKANGMVMCQSYARQHGRRYLTLIPAALYGVNDNFSLQDSHVIPGMMRRLHEAKLRGDRDFTVWGSGNPRREFLYADDLAEATIFLLDNYRSDEPVNVGCGSDVSVRELAEAMKDITGYGGALSFDASKPDGMPRKLLDSGRVQRLGWKARTPLREGLARVYRWFLENQDKLRA